MGKIRVDLLVVLAIFVLVVCVSGCSSDKEYQVSDSKFTINSNTWTFNNDTSTTDSIAFKNGLLTMRVTQYENEAEYESNYKDSASSYTYYKIKTENKTIKGIQVRFNNISDTRNTDTFQDYFFQKNGKYYSISIIDYSKTQPFQEDIKTAVESIISTLN